MTHGLGEWEGKPMRADAIASELGITPNSVYVTRRRVKQLLGLANSDGRIAPKRVYRTETGIPAVVNTLKAELERFDTEVGELRKRLEQIDAERPEVEAALNRLEHVAEREPAAA